MALPTLDNTHATRPGSPARFVAVGYGVSAKVVSKSFGRTKAAQPVGLVSLLKLYL